MTSNNEQKDATTATTPTKFNEDTIISSSGQKDDEQNIVKGGTIGKSMTYLSDIINDNIIAARYGTFATISLLVAYGLANTPLFSRYKKISDIPASLFTTRKTIYGRVVHVYEKDVAAINAGIKDNENPIVCLVRHLSPVGRFMNRSAFDFTSTNSPTSYEYTSKGSRNLLKVEIAGIKAPPSYVSKMGQERQGEWLRNLATNRTPISCTLLSRRIIKEEGSTTTTTTSSSSDRPKLSFPSFIEGPNDQTAICNIKFRPNGSIFRKDLASSLVQHGRASVASSSGIHIDIPHTSTKDGSTKLSHIRKDAEYLERLEKLEFEAVIKSYGMWSDDAVCESRPDLVEEAEFQKSASVFSKIWRRLWRGS